MTTVNRVKPGERVNIEAKVRKVSTSVADQSSNLKVVVYGRSGTGKTTFSGTFPKPLLHVVCSSIGLNESIPLQKMDGVYDLLIERSSEILEVPAYVTRNRFQTLVLDHVTGLQDLVLKEILELDEVPVQKSYGLATQAQYGQLTLQMKELLRRLLVLPMNVVIIAQEREVMVDELTGVLTPYVTTAVTPSLASWLHASADYILHTYIRQKTSKILAKVGNTPVEVEKPVAGYIFAAHVGPNPVFVTKVRTSQIKELPESVDNPTYESLLNLIR